MDKEKLVYIDEAWLDKYIYREYAKWIKWERVYAKISWKKYQRYSIISWRNYENKFVWPFIYSWTADSNLVNYWTEKILLPSLEEWSILIWDNASIHKKFELKRIIEEKWHKMIFLPPYSPDLNPIEHKWNELKQKLKKVYDDSIYFLDNIILNVNIMSKLILA